MRCVEDCIVDSRVDIGLAVTLAGLVVPGGRCLPATVVLRCVVWKVFLVVGM